MHFLKGKRGVIMGVANEKSLAWSIAQAAANSGASLAFTYQGEVLRKRVEPLAASVNSDMIIECDVSNPESISSAFDQISKKMPSIDFVVHSIAFAQKEDLQGRFIDTSYEGFATCMNISCYSLIAIANHSSQLMTNGGSIITMTYYGAEKVIPNYNVMGVAKSALESSVRYLAQDLGGSNIRVNAISAGPIKTLAGAGISGFRQMLQSAQDLSLLKRNITAEEVGKTGLYLLSDLSSGVTGEVIHVDCGYHCVGAHISTSDIASGTK